MIGYSIAFFSIAFAPEIPPAAAFSLISKYGISSVHEFSEWVTAGDGLVSYGASLTGMWRRGAYYVDRILKGASPADLPVEQPRIFELVVSRRRAKALGITPPDALIARADNVIE